MYENIVYIVCVHCIHIASFPDHSQLFNVATLKLWEWPGDEASIHIYALWWAVAIVELNKCDCRPLPAVQDFTRKVEGCVSRLSCMTTQVISYTLFILCLCVFLAKN